MTNTNTITETTYNTWSEARQAAWAAGYRVVDRPDTRDIMSDRTGNTVIRLMRGEGCIYIMEL